MKGSWYMFILEPLEPPGYKDTKVPKFGPLAFGPSYLYDMTQGPYYNKCILGITL